MSEEESDKKKDKEKDMSEEDKKEKDAKDSDVEVEQKRTKKIKIDINRDPEITALQKELAERAREIEDFEKKREEWEAEKQKIEDEKTKVGEERDEMKGILEKQALDKFESEKKSLVDLAKNSGLDEDKVAEIEEKIKTPKDVETVKTLVNMLVAFAGKKKEGEEKKEADDGEKKTKPQGKAPFVSPPDAKQWESGVKMVDDLYRKRYNIDGKSTKQEIEDAEKQIKTLWDTLFKSKSIEQIRRGTSIGRTVSMSCPSCAGTIVGASVPEKCPWCGYDLTKTGDREPTEGVS